MVKRVPTQLLVLISVLLLVACAIPNHQETEKLLLLRHKNRGRYYSPGNKVKYWLRSDGGSKRHKGVLESVSDSSIQVSSQALPIQDIWYLKRGRKVDLDKWKPVVLDFNELVEVVNDY